MAELKSDNLLEMMKFHLTTDAGKELTKKIGLVYQLNIAPQGEYEGGKPDVIFSFKDDDFLEIATGKMNPQVAFMRELEFSSEIHS
ncbi:hypothetical protein ERO13_A06G018633v2 [Gossypium hirsutum]|uniref:SCP2 domain-containing protein n=1 Tax=Gossypium tomentosum TaxID=34277 RepID=A0A5D2PYZ5_GOSTO|nr:hypothetical protein ERO13_A06G018633v2 [Gossypium hirsutum]TYI21192.1 hypothetical protein ES332_A06G020600v1 [Gossypium tomentosum]